MPPCGDPRRARVGFDCDAGRPVGWSRDANCGILAAWLAVAGTEFCAGMGSTAAGIRTAVSPARMIVRNKEMRHRVWLSIGLPSLAVGVAEIFLLVPKAEA